MPHSGTPDKEPHFLIRVRCAVYGLFSAPAGWRTDGRGCAGVVLLDVDDFVQGGNERHRLKMEELRLKFSFGKWRDLYMNFGEYLGRTVKQRQNFEIKVDMKRFYNGETSSSHFASRPSA